MGRGRRLVALVVLVVVTALASGCSPMLPATALDPEGVAMLAKARATGIASADPFALDDASKRTLENQVGRFGSAQERIERLLRWIQRGDEGFVHDAERTVDAQTAFASRRGGCVSHSLLVVSAARFLGVDAFMLHARSAPQYLERSDALLALTHVAVGWQDATVTQLVDVWIPHDQWRLVEYERLDDRAALALYYGNLAVADLRAGRLDEAESTLRFLVREAPDVAEVRANLVATLLRRHDYVAALGEAREGVAHFPRFSAFYTNGYLAAMACDDDVAARDFATRGNDLAQVDPIFLYVRGVRELRDGNGAGAARAFEGALAINADSVLLRAWLVRARLSAGDEAGAAVTFAEARKLAPDDMRLRELADRYPTLGQRR